ncbi:MAG: hypothetical protein QOH71_1269 [Blastocatellia bacterium]|jgi:hypothetical protein|nr:hypothetical protein [Blastocatellia bacterium]
MTKTARFLGTCLLIGSMTTVVWADGGETHGGGLASPSPTPVETTTDSTSPLTLEQDASATSAEVVNVLVTWLVQSIL